MDLLLRHIDVRNTIGILMCMVLLKVDKLILMISNKVKILTLAVTLTVISFFVSFEVITSVLDTTQIQHLTVCSF